MGAQLAGFGGRSIGRKAVNIVAHQPAFPVIADVEVAEL